jgi:hypothetical protein
MGKESCHGPGEYRPHPTEGIVCPEQLPPPTHEVIDRDKPHAPCPTCQRRTGRLRRCSRELHDVGDPLTGRPRELTVRYAQYHCRRCGAYFSTDLSDLCPPRGEYTHRVMQLAVRLVVEDDRPYRPASWQLWRDHQVFVPFATIQNWVEGAGEKGGPGGARAVSRSRAGGLQRLRRRG